MNLKNYALITGASAGIGEACADILAKGKKNLILIARRKEKLDELKNRLEKEYAISVLTYKVDLGEQKEIEAFFEEVKDKKIDVLINNAGLALSKSSFQDYKWEDFERMIDINIKAFTRVAHLSIPHLIETKGHIVNISSIAGIEGYEGGSVYSSSKAFVKMMNKNLRIDLAGTGIRVTDIAPGHVETEFSVVRFKGDKQKADNVYKGFVPLHAKDIAEAVLFSINRPESVNIEYMLVMPTAQASAKRIIKDI